MMIVIMMTSKVPHWKANQEQRIEFLTVVISQECAPLIYHELKRFLCCAIASIPINKNPIAIQ